MLKVISYDISMPDSTLLCSRNALNNVFCTVDVYIQTYHLCFCRLLTPIVNKMLSYSRETALQGALVLDKSGRLES